jgi:hypothetical protein
MTIADMLLVALFSIIAVGILVRVNDGPPVSLLKIAGLMLLFLACLSVPAFILMPTI